MLGKIDLKQIEDGFYYWFSLMKILLVHINYTKMHFIMTFTNVCIMYFDLFNPSLHSLVFPPSCLFPFPK
jgi:hypothetical protein